MIYIVSDDGGTPEFVETNKFAVTEYCGKQIYNNREIHLQIWSKGLLLKENWVTGNMLLKIENSERGTF